MMMAIKEENDPINNKPDSNGESKISEPKEECSSEPAVGPSADDECILGSESDAHNQKRENMSHEEIILKKEESLNRIPSQ